MIRSSETVPAEVPSVIKSLAKERIDCYQSRGLTVYSGFRSAGLNKVFELRTSGGRFATISVICLKRDLTHSERFDSPVLSS